MRLARACEADDGAALAAQVCLDASIVGGLAAAPPPRGGGRSRRAGGVSQLGTHTGWDAPDESVVRCDGVRAAWALLHAGARLIDGLEVGLHRAPPPPRSASSSRRRRRCSRRHSGRAHADVGVGPHRVQVDAEPVATATLQRLLEAGRRPHVARGAAAADGDDGGGADELLEALGAWQRFFDGDDDEEEEGGGGTAEGGGGGWEDSDDDGVPWADDG